jgi:hypothetical protein
MRGVLLKSTKLTSGQLKEETVAQRSYIFGASSRRCAEVTLALGVSLIASGLMTGGTAQAAPAMAVLEQVTATVPNYFADHQSCSRVSRRCRSLGYWQENGAYNPNVTSRYIGWITYWTWNWNP